MIVLMIFAVTVAFGSFVVSKVVSVSGEPDDVGSTTLVQTFIGTTTSTFALTTELAGLTCSVGLGDGGDCYKTKPNLG